MSKMDSVIRFEMPYNDRERMAKFYRDAFGWQTRGEEMGNMSLPRRPKLMRAVPSDQAQ